MKRSPPPKRKAALRRFKRVAPLNRKRKAAMLALHFGRQAALCRESPCCMCGSGPSEPHHEPPRSCGGDDDDTLPLCAPCHRRRHSTGIETFWGAVDWRDIVAEMQRRAWEAA